jgi:hypothetical protein
MKEINDHDRPVSVLVLRVDDSIERATLNRAGMRKSLAADILEGVPLRDGRHLLVDESGLLLDKPMNVKATAVCLSLAPRFQGQIYGDAVLGKSEDLGYVPYELEVEEFLRSSL